MSPFVFMNEIRVFIDENIITCCLDMALQPDNVLTSVINENGLRDITAAIEGLSRITTSLTRDNQDYEKGLREVAAAIEDLSRTTTSLTRDNQGYDKGLREINTTLGGISIITNSLTRDNQGYMNKFMEMERKYEEMEDKIKTTQKYMVETRNAESFRIEDVRSDLFRELQTIISRLHQLEANQQRMLAYVEERR